jgi:hypothetical protein
MIPHGSGLYKVLCDAGELYCSHHNATLIEVDLYGKGITMMTPARVNTVSWEEVYKSIQEDGLPRVR